MAEIRIGWFGERPKTFIPEGCETSQSEKGDEMVHFMQSLFVGRGDFIKDFFKMSDHSELCGSEYLSTHT